MTNTVLKRDDTEVFPHVVILKASAGSGKTHTLTKRYVQFVLSSEIPENRLRNILAVTFSNNAAKEMRQRIVLWLKEICLNYNSRVTEIKKIINLPEEEIKRRSCLLIDEILNHYSDFQVKTIDSFMASVFKASVLDLGYEPDFEILLNGDDIMEYAFEVFLRSVREGTHHGAMVSDIVRIIMENRSEDSRFLWDPSRTILEEIKKIYKKISKTKSVQIVYGNTNDAEKIKGKIKDAALKLDELIEGSELSRSGNSSFGEILKSVQMGNFADIINRGLKNPPIKKPAKKSSESELVLYDEAVSVWRGLTSLIGQFAEIFSRTYFIPFIRAYEAFAATLQHAKKQKGKVFIEDISRRLSLYIDGDIVPDVYFRLGETIYHYLIDEFQDTSPIQWKNLYPLIENSLSQGGSLFAVGDTKQAIYGFRDADYSIMKSFESEDVENRPFLSAEHRVTELSVNFRSQQPILDFNEEIFKHILPQNETYNFAAQLSGLSDYTQTAKNIASNGFVRVDTVSALTDSDETSETEPVKQKLYAILDDLKLRGYKYKDIAVLTMKNDDVVTISTWLNEKGIENQNDNSESVPFISYSSLDIRKTNAACEIVALLNFLDSPLDDLSFATFLSGRIFAAAAALNNQTITLDDIRTFLFNHRRENSPLYKCFQADYPELWNTFFEQLFNSAGYFPLYDLVTEIYRVFKVFDETQMSSEASLVKILEVIKTFEETGKNSLRDFVNFAAEGDGASQEWNIDVPKTEDAVSVMTVHKSKGLGFPVTIVILYAQKDRPFDYILEGDTDVSLLKLNKKILAAISHYDDNSPLNSLYEKEKTKELVNKLNALYVSLTRAKNELYVILATNGGKYPFELFPEGDTEAGRRVLYSDASEDTSTDVMPILHTLRPPYHFGVNLTPINIGEKQRGDFIHRVLSFVDYISDDFKNTLNRIVEMVNLEYGNLYNVKETTESLLRFLQHDDIKPYFIHAKERVLKKEQEYTTATGVTLRMDRVVIDNDSVCVIDYKTGRAHDEMGYVSQIKDYLRILREFYPNKNCTGLIAYTDMQGSSLIK
ncbi:UvrD-helicase domain-containing protein [Candidatus Magnetomonas plexicatena]|uniref:UvrD-helicase domain-containing protein n=1 Tax=Candidatus Magnetomonas plexicatena TaxID=2552947 RepID=UPI001C75CACD|nr:UvrD-helicase domain-containing protein [Nitrospirales bacterium LBB_01]